MNVDPLHCARRRTPAACRRVLLLICAALFCLGVTASANQVTFSEVMYHPTGTKPEFIEVQNLAVTPLDMARWQFTQGITYVFPDFVSATPQAHILQAYERILLSSADDATTRAAYPSIPAGVRIFGPWIGTLSDGGETITLLDRNGVIVATLNYGDSGKWPIQADGIGHSLVLADLNAVPDDWRVWRASTNRDGSPGVADPAPPAKGLALNEIHFRPAGNVDWVEVRNNSPFTTISGGTLFLASKADLSDKVTIGASFSPGTVGSIAVDVATDASGDARIYLVDAANTVIDAVKVKRTLGRDSWQLYPPGSKEWYSDTASTRDAPNNPARNTDIVINEIMVNPPDGQTQGEFVELFNRGAGPVNIGNWQLNDAVKYTFPVNTVLQVGGYMVVAANKTYLNASYPGLIAQGNWSGSLKNSGDRIRLEDANGNLVNQVDYRFGGEWPELAGGNGSSLELINAFADNSFGGAWADSDESTKSTFTSFSLPMGTYADSTQGAINDDELRMWSIGDSHLILKNIVLRPSAGGANVLANAGVATLTNENITGWQSRGTHWQTFSDAEGLHLIADGHGDNKLNHIKKDASTASGTPGLVLGAAYTLTFDARWVYGAPRIVTQSWDLSIGAAVRVPIPANLGTPGAANSRAVATLPPQISGITHAPAVPKPNSTVLVTTQVSSNTPLSAVTLFHRIDTINNDGAWNTVAMNDSGTGGDAVAGDGIYSATIALASFSNYNVSGAIVQYYTRATAANGATSDQPKTGPNAPALWVCDSQTVGTDLRRVRVVLSAYWGDALSQDSATGGHTAKFNFKFPRLSNHYFPCTFILNDTDIFHGSSVRKTGSPFTRATSNALDRGKIVIPGDRSFHDNAKLYWDNDAGAAMYHNRIARYWLYLMGVPGNENEVCRITKNNATYAVRETNEVFDKDMINRIWPNGSKGYWYEMDDRFWIADDGSTRLNNNDASFAYKTGDSQGADNPTAYHNNFTPKTREVDYNYSALINWCKQIQTNTTITNDQMERMVDVKNMAAYAAVRGYIADWDNITMGRGKNGYIYQRPTDQRFMFMHWDSDNAFQNTHIDDALIGGLTNIATFYGKPYVRRYLDSYLYQLLTSLAPNGPRITAWLTAEENSSPSFAINPIYQSWPSVTGTSGQTRPQLIQSFIGTSSLSATFTLSTPAAGASISSNTVDFIGRAPMSAFKVICVGHPEAIFSWPSTSVSDVAPWKLAAIQLASGSNNLTFRALDEFGTQIGSDLTRTINHTADSSPVASLVADPASQNVALGEVLTMDAGASYDPENAGPMSYSWSVSPAANVTTTVLSPSRRQFVFSTPGSYDINVQIGDIGGLVTSITRTITVFNAADRDTFGSSTISGYAISNMKLLDNYQPDAWYSLSDVTGSLVIQITDRNAKPLNTGAPTFPLLTRSVPSTTDFSIQTDLTLVNPQIASYLAGIYLETVENGLITRYAFAFDGGTALRIYSSSAGGTYTTLGSIAFASGDCVLRILRTGTSLRFQRRVNGLWINAYTRVMPAGSTATSGGLFSATTSAQFQKVAFDYLLVSDPGNSTDLTSNLRVTEVMYEPAPGGVEYIELQNVGTTPLDVTGAYFDNGNPWSNKFTFGNLTLQPKQYCIVTNDIALFQSLYGTSLTIAGQATGSLNNAGERITLRDASDNLILDFTYNSLAPWPVSIPGKSLEALSYNSASYANPSNWRLSQETGGSPGYLGLATDTDGDGIPDSVELAFGVDPANPGSRPVVSLTRNTVTGSVTVNWSSVAGRAYKVQYRDSLAAAWQDLGSVTATGATASYLDPTNTTQDSRFYQVTTRLP